jgi:hypothetical protein
MKHPHYYPTYDSQELSILNSNDIFVLKTNILTKDDRDKIAPLLMEDDRIKRWTVDIYDIDKVLRIESQHLKLSEILDLTRQAGYYSEELPD